MERIELSSDRKDYQSGLEDITNLSKDVANLKLDSDYSSKDRKKIVRNAKVGEKWAYFGLGVLSTGAISCTLAAFPNLYKDIHGAIYDSQDAFGAVGVTSLALGTIALGIGCKKIFPLYSKKKQGNEITENLSKNDATNIKHSLKRLYENN
jgi:hypothetical protein|tara:strand:+ start:606 stop:1058 length:453 start_codon:yes stop_codon:yes gene_type:complete